MEAQQVTVLRKALETLAEANTDLSNLVLYLEAHGAPALAEDIQADIVNQVEHWWDDIRARLGDDADC